jgi:hypothetical protein
MKTAIDINLMDMVVLYIKECLLFKSDNRLHKIMGVFGWLSIIAFSYAMLQVYLITQALANH